MSQAYEESRVNRQKAFVRNLINRYNEELHVVISRKSVPPNPTATKVMEELVLPAQQWLTQRTSLADIRAKLAWEVSDSNEGQESIFFLQVLFDKANGYAQELLDQFADMLRRNPYPIKLEDPQDRKDIELLKKIHSLFSRINVYDTPAQPI